MATTGGSIWELYQPLYYTFTGVTIDTHTDSAPMPDGNKSMDIEQAQRELNAMQETFAKTLKEFTERTGLMVDVSVYGRDVTGFGKKTKRIIYDVEMTIAIKAGHE